ncbi:MAG: 50S ribosomal protein L15 [Pantoea sp. Brub]|nr:50S ribosomal protein L15 [Pantoea sp. Brub]
MYLNTLSPALKSKFAKKRVGRGIGSGWGKTCGRGHKGQKSRSGGTINRGFEGGQMPIYRRLPKFGFISHKNIHHQEITLANIVTMKKNIINLKELKAAKIISHQIKSVKIINSGQISIPITISGLNTTKGANIAIKNAGGKIL